MKFHQLRGLIAVAEAGSLRAAARALGQSQPALSKSLAMLEAELDAPLVTRSGRGVTLTPFGQALLVRARRAESELRRAEQEIAQMRGGVVAGTVSVGVSPAAAAKLVPPAVKAFRAMCAGAQVRIVDGMFPLALPLLRDGTIDMLIGPLPARSIGRELKCERLYHNDVVAVVRKGHPLAGARDVKALAGAEWVNWGPDDGPGGLIGQFLAAHDMPSPRFAVLSESFLSLQALLAGTDLIGALPAQVLEDHSSALVPLPLDVRFPGVMVGIVTRADSTLTPLARMFADEVKRIAANVRRARLVARA